jgi:hypothetical protein
MKCIEENCNTRGTFNYLNEIKPIYCEIHKKIGMINVRSKKCKEFNCKKQPAFNLPNKKSGIYCNEHKKVGMINMISKRCKEFNCDKQPAFNLEYENIAIYCKEHSKDNMVNVISKRCKELNCNKQPYFNLPNEKDGIYCKYHAKDNMIDIKSKKCLEQNCNKHPSFNLQNQKVGIYCKEHKKIDMVDVKSKRCLEKNCDTQVKNNKYKGYCVRCFIYKFPDVKISRYYKVKENHMTDFIKDQFKEEVKVFDKQTGGCSKRRPDVCIDKFTLVIITECDENQHRETSCENKRTMELFQDFGNRPIVFIRFNPDSYINEKNKKIPSSFKMHKALDVPMIRDQKEWTKRNNQ